MKHKVFEKDRLPTLIDELVDRLRVFAPVDSGKYFRLKEISSGEEVRLDFHNTKLASKEILFPQTELILTIKKGEEGLETEEASTDEEERVIFGIRPCDARGLVLTDMFFASGDHKDQIYLEKREKTAVVGLACNHIRETCFCTQLGGSPFGKEGMDLLLVDLGDKYLVELLTERGETLVDSLQWMTDADEGDLERAEELRCKAEDAIKTELPIEGLSEKLDGMFEDPLWDKVHQKCVGCGICSYLCPTCWCFDILDEETPTGVKRIRLWDTCQFPIFTLQGSGFNPRPSGKERMRQRILHKFSYFPKDFGTLACVGCGRCVQECPVNLDIREIIKTIMSE